ncbi:MAG: nuclear transport factor 2 family protein [Alphaproteobacteria bacterium]
MTTMETLLDRIQIEDLLYNYYSLLGTQGEHFDNYYVENGVLDVNGTIFEGRSAILTAYEPESGAMPRTGKFHMLLSNPRIVVNGDTAVADAIWTGIISDAIKAPPRFVEQGREHDELVKRNGRWYFKKRVITSDSGLPAAFEKNYRPR